MVSMWNVGQTLEVEISTIYHHSPGKMRWQNLRKTWINQGCFQQFMKMTVQLSQRPLCYTNYWNVTKSKKKVYSILPLYITLDLP